jgi:hypothetical protein
MRKLLQKKAQPVYVDREIIRTDDNENRRREKKEVAENPDNRLSTNPLYDRKHVDKGNQDIGAFDRQLLDQNASSPKAKALKSRDSEDLGAEAATLSSMHARPHSVPAESGRGGRMFR